MQRKKSGFSLIELSIVILIIAVIIAGVTQSSSLLAKAKLQSAQTATLNSPVAGIPDLSLWFETSLDKSFVTTSGASQTEDEAPITQWNDINPQVTEKFFLVPYNGGVFYKKDSGPNNLPSIYIASLDADSQPFVQMTLRKNLSDQYPVGYLNPNMTLFIVYRANTNISTVGIYNEQYTLAPAPYLGRNHTFFLDPLFDDLVSTSEVTTSAEIASLTSDNSSANLYINGINKASGTAGPYNFTMLFAAYGADSYISEIIFFSRALKNSERQSIEKYLGRKYGIAVAS
jgi:prepilin-type N-terminal cleavage/methylation domain-containing protein